MGLLIDQSVQFVLYALAMGLLIWLTKRTICLKSQKTVYLGHGIAHRVNRTIWLKDRKRYT